jgi:hypothetical protein
MLAAVVAVAVLVLAPVHTLVVQADLVAVVQVELVAQQVQMVPLELQIEAVVVVVQVAVELHILQTLVARVALAS